MFPSFRRQCQSMCFRDSSICRKIQFTSLKFLPILLAAMLWSVYLAKAQTVWYIDNESARMAMIRDTGETEFASRFISGFVSLECSEQVKSWFARVPSFSNIADGASRLECQQLLSLGVVQTTLRWESFEGLVDGKGSAAGGNSDLSPLRVEKVSE